MADDTTNALRALAELLTHAQPWPDHFRGAGERITLHLTTDFRDLILEALATTQPEAKPGGDAMRLTDEWRQMAAIYDSPEADMRDKGMAIAFRKCADMLAATPASAVGREAVGAIFNELQGN